MHATIATWGVGPISKKRVWRRGGYGRIIGGLRELEMTTHIREAALEKGAR
jgi:hypothetical protein